MLDLIANVRRDEICAILKKQQAATTVSLAADFDVSIGATVLIGLMEKSHKHKGFERSINSINLKIK